MSAADGSPVRTFLTDILTIAGVIAALAVPLDARADDLSPGDLETVDRALASATAPACAESRDQLRALREAYARQESPVVRSAIAARVPSALDTLSFCVEAASGQVITEPIEVARQALASSRTREQCAASGAGIEPLIAAWEAESSAVVRSAIELRLSSLAQSVRFCLETLERDPPRSETLAPVDAPAPPSETTSEPTIVAPIAPLATSAPTATGGRALGSPFLPPR